MTHLPFTLAAYLFNALAVLSSKFLLTKTIPDPLVYIFYISLVSFLAVLALPFTKIPSFEVFSLASLSTLLWTLGAYFMYKALRLGKVSRVIPVIGTLIPLILLVFAFQASTISNNQILAVVVLTLGMVFLTITDWRGGLSKQELILELLSAAFFAASYIVLREAYLLSDFFSVLVWSRLILLPFGVLILTVPSLKKKIISPQGLKINFLSYTGLIFLGGQLSGAIAELLLLFSISLANPALVNSLQGTQYIFLLIFAVVLSRISPTAFQEKHPPKVLASKSIGIILIGIGLYFLAVYST